MSCMQEIDELYDVKGEEDKRTIVPFLKLLEAKYPAYMNVPVKFSEAAL